MRHGNEEPMKKAHLSVIIAAVMIFSLIPGGCSDAAQSPSEPFRLLVCTENRDMEDVIRYFCKDNNISIQIEYKNIFETIETLNSENCPFDGVWLSDSGWLNMVSGPNRITNVKSVSINPLVYAVKKSKALKLGLTAKKVSTADVINKINSGDLIFLLPAQPHSDSGISVYLSFFYAAAQNPALLTSRYFKDEKILADMRKTLACTERIQVSDENLTEAFLSGSYDAAAGYEFEFIAINKRLTEEGKEPLQLIYPSDGVFLCDSPFAHIDKGDSGKSETFFLLQNFLLSETMQKEMAQSGRRTGYGGQNPYASESVFSPAWGIDMKAPLPQLSFPPADTLSQFALLLNTRLRKPSVTILLFDTSMDTKEDAEDLNSAVKYMLNYRNGDNDHIQFYNHDIIYFIAFGKHDFEPLSAKGTGLDVLLERLDLVTPLFYSTLRNRVTSDLYTALFLSFEILKEYSSREYSFSVVLFTDEERFADKYPDRSKELAEKFSGLPNDTELFIITVAGTDTRIYDPIINAANGRLTYAKTGTASIFREIRRYTE